MAQHYDGHNFQIQEFTRQNNPIELGQFRKPSRSDLNEASAVEAYWKSYKFILKDPKLDQLEKNILIIMRCLTLKESAKVCFASNKYLANELGTTPKAIDRAMTRLRKKEYITSTYKQGGYRRTSLHLKNPHDA